MTTRVHPLTRYTNEAVGAMVLVALLIFAIALTQSGRMREWFNPGQTIKITLPDEGLFGLADGADVEILGTKAGQVRRIVIEPDSQMHADIYIRGDMSRFVRTDSQVIIRKRFGVAGDAFLEITRGIRGPLDWEFAVMDASADLAPTETMGKVISELREKALPVIDETASIVTGLAALTDSLQRPDGDLQLFLGNLNSVSGKIERGEGAVGRLLTESKVVREMEDLLAQTSASMERIGPILDELQNTARSVSGLGENLNQQSAGLPQVTDTAQAVLQELEGVLRDLRKTTPELPNITRGVGEMADAIPPLLLQTQQTVSELEKLLTQLRSNWLLGGNADPSANQRSGERLSPLNVEP